MATFKKGAQASEIKKIASELGVLECVIWGHERSHKGYGRVQFDGRRQAAHRVVCNLAHGCPPTEKHVVAHSCGNGHKGCVNPAHLRWATTKENCADKILHGTIARGVKNGNARISEEQAMQALKLRGTASQQAIAKKLQMTRSSVRDIHTGRSWAWLPREGAH